MKKVLSVILTLAFMVTFLNGIIPPTDVSAATTGHARHPINPGVSANDNPLKGFVPFYNTSYVSDFPHSMEFAYIPLKDVQTGSNTFNWTALDNILDGIAARGNQACFRFYMDYPGKESGIPQFLLDGGLVTYPYTDYDNTTSVIPNYEDTNLRTALKNFIAALGARYDGDSRIGFITLGLLGFWGEWHCGSNATRVPSTAVMNEVLTAYDNAFNTTRILARYPNSGNAASMNMGFHDDSFAYETLPYSMGGKWTNFAQRLMDVVPSCVNKWQTQPIGGEIRPEIKQTIFEETPWGASHEKWSDCLSVVHPSWMMNTDNYTGTERENAITAGKQMGYEFQVNNAYFNDITTNTPLYVGIDMKNIGIAPFYYNWNFQVGVKQNGTVVKTWNTGWNITTVPADAGNRTFEYTASNHGLAAGTYTLAIKLVNPLSGGKPLRFANDGQNTDGWLDLGSIKVSAFPSNLAGWWTMNESTGSTTADLSGNNNTGYLTNGPVWVSAMERSALNFDGNNSYVSTGNSASLENVQEGNYTLTAWFKADTVPASSGYNNNYAIIMKKGYHTGLYYESNQKFRMDHYLTGNFWVSAETNSTFVPGRWNHVAGVVDKTAGTVKIYVNGVLQGSNSFTPGTAAREYGTETWRIGIGSAGDASYRYAADGSIDDVRIYNKSLNNTEIQSIYTDTTIPASLFGFNENTGTTTADVSGNSNTGYLNNGSVWTTGIMGSALNFDGNNSYVSSGNSPSLENVQEESYTLTAWFKADTVPAALGYNRYYGIVMKKGWHMGLYYTNEQKFQMDHYLTGNNLVRAASSSTFSPGTWNHVAGVVDKAAGTMKVYVNGVLQETTTFTPGTAAIEYGTETWRVGIACPNDLNNRYAADGSIDDVRIYGRALSDTEIQRFYTDLVRPACFLRFNENTGTSAADSSGSGNTGISMNGPIWTTGLTGSALHFDGVNSYVKIPNAASLENIQENSYTLSAWFKADTVPASSGYNRYYGILMKKGDNMGLYYTNGQKFQMDHYLTGNTLIRAGSSSTFAPGTWNHVAGVVDNAAGTMKIYVNGVLQGTSTFTAGTGAVEYGAEPWKVGIAIPDDVYNRFAADGSIDDVRIYSRPLCDKEIVNLYNFR